MQKTTKKTEKAAVTKPENTNPKESWYAPVLRWLEKAAYFVFKIIAALFVVATSLESIDGWLSAQNVNSDFALAGAILVESIAVYLIVRKR